MNSNDKLWTSSLEDINKGFLEETEHYECLICSVKIEKGIIYQEADVFYEAEKFMKVHIEKFHGSVFDYLIGLDKRITGLSDHQNGLLKLFYQGKSDVEIQEEMEIGSSSTIRNHRFILKEKERQAKMFLVMMGLLKAKDKKFTSFVPSHKTAKMVDDRYNVTADENEKILMKYFPEGEEGPLKTFDMKEKSKLVVLKHLLKRFEQNRIYTEKEVNEILKYAYSDFATIRRYLIEYGFMERKVDCSQYWVKGDSCEMEAEKMDRKQELKRQYKEMKTEAGVYQIRNTVNNKVFVIGTPNLKTMNGRRIGLENGGHVNPRLQAEINQFGHDAFVFEILEVLEEKEEGFFDLRDELKKLEAKWIKKLQPFGDKGYN